MICHGGDALVWFVDERRITRLKAEPPRSEHHRHRRKYAEGKLEPQRTFHFRGPGGKLDLRAQNLNTFVQLAEGIDAETWQFHLKRGDFSKWLRTSVKDSELADEVRQIEGDDALDDRASREKIREEILKRYTAPA